MFTRIATTLPLLLLSTLLPPQAFGSDRLHGICDKDAGVKHISLLGQSNAAGTEALPVISMDGDTFGGISFKRGIRTWRANDHPATPEDRNPTDFSFRPLKETMEYGVLGETVSSGMLAQLIQSACGAGYTAAKTKVLFSYSAKGGIFLDELDQRDMQLQRGGGGGGYFKTFADDLRRARWSAQSLGLDYEPIALWFMQGENESVGRITANTKPLEYDDFLDRYSKDLERAYVAWNEKVKAVLGRPQAKIPMLISQVMSDWSGEAQLLASHNNEHISVVGPVYQLPSAVYSEVRGKRGATVHLSADGQRWLGELSGRVLGRILRYGRQWRPLEPIAVERLSDRQIRIKFFVPKPPLRFETSWLPKARNMGFSVWGGSKNRLERRHAIDGVQIQGDDVIITLSAQARLGDGEPAIVQYASESWIAPGTGRVKKVEQRADGNFAVYLDAGDAAQIAEWIEKGPLVIRQSVEGSASLLVTDVRSDGNGLVILGTPLQTLSGFKTGEVVDFFRDRPFGNLADSDFGVSTGTYRGSRPASLEGKRYPMENFSVIFTMRIPKGVT
jgi:hypothetical protein